MIYTSKLYKIKFWSNFKSKGTNLSLFASRKVFIAINSWIGL